MAYTDLSGATDEGHLVNLWLAGRPASTLAVYRPVAEEFLRTLQDRPGGLRVVTVAEVVRWVEGLAGEPATRARKVATIKSLLTFSWRTGYVLHNVGRAIQCVKVPSKLHTRFVEEPAIKALFAAASGRDRVFLRLMYYSGARLKELCMLTWRDVAQPGRVSLLGKGSKTRTVVVPLKVLDEVLVLKPRGAAPSDPVFCSKRDPREPLGVRDAREIVYSARDKVLDDPTSKGLVPENMSPHFIRHTHSVHAIDGGAPLHVLQHSLGHASLSTTSVYLHVRPNEGSATYLKL